MDTRPPHDIVPEPEIPKNTRHHYVRLTDDEEKQLSGMSPDERAVWIDENIPSNERLARYLEAEGVTQLVKRARDGEFSDFNSPHVMPQHKLVDLLKKLCRPDIAKLVIDGVFDATMRESDEWAKAELAKGGEVADVLHGLIKKAP